MERKVNLLTCEAAVSIYSGQMLIPDAKHPSSRTDFSFILNLTYHFPTPILQNKTLKNTENRVNWYSFGCSWFFFLKGSEPPWLRKRWDSKAGNQTLPRAYSKHTWSRDGGSALWNFSQNPTCKLVQQIFFFCWKLSLTLLGSKDSLRLRGSY